MNRDAHDPPHSEGVYRSVTGLFHRLNSVLPIDQILISVLPETPVQEALALLEKHGFSHGHLWSAPKKIFGMGCAVAHVQKCIQTARAYCGHPEHIQKAYFVKNVEQEWGDTKAV